MSDADVPDPVARQIDAIDIRANYPLIVCDADEVLARFMAGFESFLESRQLYFNWESYRLRGNIRRSADRTPVEPTAIPVLLNDFFVRHTDTLEPVEGAAEALAALSRRAQIVVLSNLPIDLGDRRRHWLTRHGMDYPLIANTGPKGPAVRALTERAGNPAFFIDDSPQHHEAVARDAGHVRRLHFVADPRLSKLLDDAPHSHHRADRWRDARAFIEADLAAQGL